jgi:hypothetical protein
VDDQQGRMWTGLQQFNMLTFLFFFISKCFQLKKKILLLSAAPACLNIPDAKKKTHTLKKKTLKKNQHPSKFS